MRQIKKCTRAELAEKSSDLIVEALNSGYYATIVMVPQDFRETLKKDGTVRNVITCHPDTGAVFYAIARLAIQLVKLTDSSKDEFLEALDDILKEEK